MESRAMASHTRTDNYQIIIKCLTHKDFNLIALTALLRLSSLREKGKVWEDDREIN
jgi:hypothetical protein